MEMNQDQQADYTEIGDHSDESKFVVFRLGQELYGSRLLEVREVVESMPTKFVPNTVPSFIGVCNLRGQIIGVVDLRLRFDLSAETSERPVFLVFETESGAIAAAVDQIVSVSIIAKESIESKPNIISAIPNQYIRGIGKLDQCLVTLVDLKAILSHDELTKLELTKMVTKVV